MNHESGEGSRGVHIKPTARRSIHSHCSECKNSLHRNMGRYGINNCIDNKRKPLRSTVIEGSDEVDNVMSKMQRPTSPVPVRKQSNLVQRRNSCDISHENYSDDDSDDNDDILSKSSPAAISIYSDELYTSANSGLPHNNQQNSRNGSRISPQASPQRTLNSSTNNQQNHMYLQREFTIQAGHSNITENNNTVSYMLQIFSVALCICIASIYSMRSSGYEKTQSIYDKLSFYSDVKDLAEKYKVKDNSILQVRTGVATIFEKQDTGSFIFAYNSRMHNYNPVIFDNFIEALAATASKYLRNDTKAVQHVVIDTSNLNMQTAKQFMKKYEDEVAKTGVMLVKDIDNVPSHIAMAFHYYCDEFSPLVRRSAIFFTLNLAKCSNDSDLKSTHDYIEKCLKKRWNTVGEDKIGPLLTRVVNIVVDVTNV